MEVRGVGIRLGPGVAVLGVVTRELGVSDCGVEGCPVLGVFNTVVGVVGTPVLGVGNPVLGV